MLSGTGALAEYVVVCTNYVLVIHAKMRSEEATTLVGMAETALEKSEKAASKQGDRIVIHGASAAAGMIATQLAKAAGATVTARCSRSKFEIMKEVGANEESACLPL